MSSVGVRELKANLSKYLKDVEAGATIRVTARGRTIATIRPVNQAADLGWMHQMVAEGRVRWNGRKPKGLANPVRLKPGAKTAAEMIIEDRR